MAPNWNKQQDLLFHPVVLVQEGLALLSYCSVKVISLLHTRAPGFICYLRNVPGSHGQQSLLKLSWEIDWMAHGVHHLQVAEQMCCRERRGD